MEDKNKFEKKLFLITKESEIAPILLTIKYDKITFSAKVDESSHPLSRKFIQEIDKFLHSLAGHEPSPACENPEEITLFLRYFLVSEEMKNE